MNEQREDETFPADEAERRFDILMRAIVGRPPQGEEECAILADIRRRNSHDK